MRVFALLIVILSLCGSGLYMVKRSIDGRYAKLAQLRAEINEEKNNHAVLQAEWAWLSRPDRIMRLSGSLLDMAPIESDRILPLDAIPMRAPATNLLAAKRQPASAGPDASGPSGRMEFAQ